MAEAVEAKSGSAVRALIPLTEGRCTYHKLILIFLTTFSYTSSKCPLPRHSPVTVAVTHRGLSVFPQTHLCGLLLDSLPYSLFLAVPNSFIEVTYCDIYPCTSPAQWFTVGSQLCNNHYQLIPMNFHYPKKVTLISSQPPFAQRTDTD